GGDQAVAGVAGRGHVEGAGVAGHALVLHAPVLAAGALPVLLGTENAFTEQAIFFRPIGTVVDGLRLFDLPKRPATDIMGAGEADAHRPVIVDSIVIGFTT